eukprot:14637418-Alexandrium_andersonii.AAC.1
MARGPRQSEGLGRATATSKRLAARHQVAVHRAARGRCPKAFEMARPAPQGVPRAAPRSARRGGSRR